MKIGRVQCDTQGLADEWREETPEKGPGEERGRDGWLEWAGFAPKELDTP